VSEDTTVTVPTNGNGTVARRDHILGLILGACIAGKVLLAGASFYRAPSDWTTVNETSHDLAKVIEMLTIGYFAGKAAGGK
jgi:hypothetical protein